MIAIIGAGPAGSYLAYLLAKEGKQVSLIEEHDEIGKPLQCTGILTSSILEIMPLSDKLIVNKVNKVRVYSSPQTFIELDIKPNFVIDRVAFDKHLFNLAVKAGAEATLGEKYETHKKIDKSILTKTSRKEILSNYLVGCDGPLSKVGNNSHLIKKRKFFVGVESRIKDKFDKEMVEFWLFDKGFGWVVPESSTTARVGIVARKNPSQMFDTFLKSKFKKNPQVIDTKGGIIPLFDSKQRNSDKNVMLCGDAAGFVKATTGGGIIQSMISSECACEAITKDKNYEKIWKKRLEKELKVHLLIRKILDRLRQKDRDELIRLFSKPKMKKLLKDIDRDNAFKLVLRCIISEPRLIKFARFLI